MGPVWEPRAPEIQRMLDEGWSIGAIAKHFGAKRHVMRSKMSQLRKKGLLQYEDRATHLPGNHDQSFGWCFVQYLKVKYPQADIDDRVRERKVVTYGRNFIGLAHGDKSRKDLIRIFPAEFPIEWSQTTNRSAHIGHLHREEEVRAKDEFGLTIRTLSTRNPIDAYHDANGYVTAHRRFMLFEYDTETLRHIHYV